MHRDPALFQHSTPAARRLAAALYSMYFRRPSKDTAFGPSYNASRYQFIS